ncbi:MAG: tetratricopeptide repeat protein, partial [Burkholderiaceae bacterium]
VQHLLSSMQFMRMTRSLVCFAIVAALGAACTPEDPDRLFASAQNYYRQGNFNAAMIQVRNALQQRPEDGALRLYLGRTLLQLHDPAAAEREFRKALQYGQLPELVLPELARAMFERGKAAELVDEFGSRTLSSPHAEARLKALLGHSYLRLQKTDDAAAAFAAATKADPDYLPAQIGLVRVAASRGNLKGAMQTADQLAASHPTSPEVHLLVAEMRSLAQDRAGTLNALAEAVRVDPRHLGARYALVEALIGEQQLDSAEALLADLRKLAKGDLRNSYFDGAVALARDNVIKARESIQRVLKQSPEHVPALTLAAAIELQDGKPFAAEALLRRAVSLAPDNVAARWMLVRACLVSDQPAKALEAVQPLLTAGGAGRSGLAADAVNRLAVTEPQFTPTLMKLGEHALLSKDLPSAVFLYKAVSDRDPSNFVALNNLAWAAGQLKDPKALHYAQRAVKLAPNNAATLDTLGELSVANGDVAKGVEYLRRATALAPNRPDIRLNYARALIKAGKRSVARSELNALQSRVDDFEGKAEVAALLKGL